jgi:ADP-ribose pyrophosphatase YjhB (NUDIX family)
MRVMVHAVVLSEDERLLVHREQRDGRERVSLPGGRVKQRESLADALVREVDEETGTAVEPGRLLYSAEINSSPRSHGVILVFAAQAVEPPPTASPSWLPLAQIREASLLPPIADRLVEDHANSWSANPHWLGDIWDGALA